MYNLPKGSSQNTKILNAFKKRQETKGKENRKVIANESEDTFKSIEESRRAFAEENFRKYGDPNIERRAIPISDFPLPTSINQVNFNPAIYTNEYNCDSFNTIFKNYQQNKNDINKLKLKTLLSDGDCLRIIDTIGKNNYDPSNWIIPDGQFKSLLNELDIFAPYNANIKNIIQIRRKAKTFPYRIKKLIAGKTKRKGTRTFVKRRKCRKTRKSTNKND
jgi:hypothetical protein